MIKFNRASYNRVLDILESSGTDSCLWKGLERFLNIIRSLSELSQMSLIILEDCSGTIPG